MQIGSMEDGVMKREPYYKYLNYEKKWKKYYNIK